MKKNKGFTLIELMIVVAVIGIIAAIAYPSYRDSVKKTQRSDAKSALTRAAAMQERFYTLNNTYTGDITKIGGSTSPEGLYTIAVDITACTNHCYKSTATPVAGGGQADDTLCSTMSIDHTGRKSATDGANDTTAKCW